MFASMMAAREAAFIARLPSIFRDRKGVTALEYGLIAALIAVAIVGAVTNVGSSLTNTFTFIATTLKTAG